MTLFNSIALEPDIARIFDLKKNVLYKYEKSGNENLRICLAVGGRGVHTLIRKTFYREYSMYN